MNLGDNRWEKWNLNVDETNFNLAGAPGRTLVSMSKRTGMTISQVTDEVLYTGLIEMQELDVQG